MVELVSALVENPLGPGFESQVPQYICCIFLADVPACFINYGPSYAFRSQAPDGPQAKSDGPDWMCTILPSQHTHGQTGKSTRMACIGPQKCYSHIQIRPTPPLVISFYFLYSFYLFVCFVNFYFYYD